MTIHDAPSTEPIAAGDVTGHVHNEPTGVVDKTELLSSAEHGDDEPLYWPSVVPVGQVLDDPMGEYYLYYSASHADSAIRLASADAPLGPYEDRGPVFEDDDAGTQTETPTVVWVPEAGQFYMYYHGFLGKNQSTALAVSTDGLDWEKQGVVIDAPPDTPGNDHTGYVKVHRFGNEWIAHHLMGGGAGGGWGVSYSTDGRDWTTDPRRLSNAVDLTGDQGRRVIWQSTNILDWHGTPWWIGEVDDYGYGGVLRESRIVHAPLRDERSFARRPRPLLEATLPWEGARTYTPDLLVDGGDVYVFYATQGEDFGNIAGAKVVSDADA